MFDVFSTRELSVLVWTSIIFMILVCKKKLRLGFVKILKIFFSKRIILPFLVMVLFILGAIILLYYLELWNKSLLKDTAFWFFGVAFVLFFTVNNAHDIGFFKGILKESIKWLLIIEFLIGFYTFSFLTELILVPVITIIVLIQAYSKIKTEYDKVNKLATNILAGIGIIIFSFVFYKTIFNNKELFTPSTLLSFLLPVILTVLLLPFLYFLEVLLKA